MSWDERHSLKEWVRICVSLRRQKAAGRVIPFVVEVNGRFAGRSAISWSELDAPVAEIAVAVGFDSPVTYRHHFGRAMRTAPSAYRRAFRAGAG